MQGEIAYILKAFPRLSETFISNEIHLLESLGMKLQLFSIKQGERDQIHDVVEQIQAPLYILPPMTSLSQTTLSKWLRENLPAYSPHHLQLLRKRPGPYLKTLSKAIWWSMKYRKSPGGGIRKVFIKEFLQAGVIALKVIDSTTIRHLHAHFCHGATTVALFASELSGRSFSFTAHAKDIYQEDQNPGTLLQIKLRRARFVTTCTGTNLEYLRTLSGRDNVHLVYHGLNTRQFHPCRERQDASSVVRILAVGRFVEKKGFHFLVEACSRLKQSGLSFHCQIIGEHGATLGKLQTMVKELDLQDRISLRGPVTHNELSGIYHQTDIFALPCQVLDNGDRDGIPNVLMEAMASGVAVVSSRISGIPELIQDEINGLLVPQKDVSALCEALQCLIEDPDRRRRLGHNARQAICQAFDARRTNLPLKQLFLECLSENPVTPRKPAPIMPQNT